MYQILIVDLVNLPADSPCQIYWLADLVNLPADSPCQIYWLADFPHRFTGWQIWWICLQIPPRWFTDWQIWWQSLNQLADLQTGRFDESSSEFLPQIYWLAELVNLPADSASPPVSLTPQESLTRFQVLFWSWDGQQKTWTPQESLTRVSGTILKLRVSMENKRCLTPSRFTD